MNTSLFSFLQKPTSIVRYTTQNRVCWGVIESGLISEINGQYATTGDFLCHAHEALKIALSQTPTLGVNEVQLLSPVTERQQFICQGINYPTHIKESGGELLPFNTIFTKASSCMIAANANIVRPAHVTMLDYEAELGIVLGADIVVPTRITPADLHRYIAGIVLVNDVSARDVQLQQGQFYKGKSYPTFGPVGPTLCLLPATHVMRLLDIHMSLKVNQQTRQDFYTGEMIYKPHETLTELSSLQSLYAGDLIATGTSGGVAAKAPGKLLMTIARITMTEQQKWGVFVKKGPRNPLYLKPGDRVELSGRTDDGVIDLGLQNNLIVAS